MLSCDEIRLDSQAREDSGAAVIKVKKLLGTTPNHRLYKEWVADNRPKSVTAQDKPVWSEEDSKFMTDLDKANKVVVALSSVPNTTFTADQLASTTFESIRRVMQEYQAKHGGYETDALPEAYLVIPPDFNASQRATIILAARRAGIQVLKLIEEPIAALYGVRRLENFGWYSITDFGDTLKHYVVRVFDGEPDLCEETYIEVPEVLPHAERAFYKHLTDRLPATKHIRAWKNEFVKIFDAARDYLIDGPEYVIPQESSWMRRTLPHISREARQLASFYSIRETNITDKIIASVSKISPDFEVTHPVVIGGNSLAYPEVAAIVESTFDSRLADTVSDPTTSLALGAAMKAAEDSSYLRTLLRGRDVSPFGHPILASNYVDSIHHHLHLSKHHVPLASTLNFGTLAAYGKIEPLLPAFHEEQLLPQNVEKPYPAISYALLRDPFSGELEHWARLSVQVPRPPPKLLTDEEIVFEKETAIPREYILADPVPDWLMREAMLDDEPELEDVQPDLSISFVLNLTASPLYDTSRNVKANPDQPRLPLVPEMSTHRHIEPFLKIMEDNPDRPQYRRIHLETDIPEELRGFYEENMVDILENIQEQKDSHSRFYRVQNRAHDLVQSIMSQLRANDHFSMIATGGMAQTPLLRSDGPIPRQMGSAKVVTGFSVIKQQKQGEALHSLTKADITGRASSKYVDAITLAHETFLEHIEERNNDTSRDLQDEVRELRKAYEDFMGSTGQPPEIPKKLLTDDFEDLPKSPWGPVEDPSEWNYPGITPGILHDWFQLYRMAKYEASDAGAKEMAQHLKSAPPDFKRPSQSEMKANWDGAIDAINKPLYNSEWEEIDDRLKMRAEHKFLFEILSRMDARKTLKRVFGHQHRMVIVTDSQPDADQLKEIESALQRATRDNVSATFISIDGTPFDGPFMQMISRVKGAKAMRFYRKNLWNNDYIQKYGEKSNAWHQAFNEDAVRNLAVKVDFPGYTIDKVYGGYMTPEEKARLEMQKTTSTIRFKIGSLSPSYDIVPGPTPLQSDPNAMLIKLKPKENFHDQMRSTDPDWLYDPTSKTTSTGLVPGSRLKPSAHTPVAFDISWNDRAGTKLNEVTTLRLTDFDSPVGYFDEPGIARLVRNAKFTEFMRKVLHAPIQDKLAMFDSDTPILEVDSHTSGIQFLGQKQENQLVKIYDEARSSVVRLANERLLSTENEGPIPKQYHKLLSVASHLFDMSAIRIQGNLETEHVFNPSADIVSTLLRSYMQASNIAPVSMYARWKGLIQANIDASYIARLEDPNFQPTALQQSSQITLHSLISNQPEMDTSLPLPPKVHVPKFHGMLLDPHEKNPLLDRRNSEINAHRFSAIQMLPRSEMAPVNATSLWAVNTFLHGDSDDLYQILSYTELQHRDKPEDLVDIRQVVRSVVGEKNWPDYERMIDLKERIEERQRLGLAVIDPYQPNDDPTSAYDPTFLSKLLSPSLDEQTWITMLTTLAKKSEKADRLREKNAILGPSLVPIAELRRYYDLVVAPHQSPDEIKRAKEIFASIEKRHAKSERRNKKESRLFDQWHELLKKERAYPNSATSYALHLIDRVRQEDIDEATRNHAIDQLDSLEQEAIDSNSVLMKHLMDNRDILNQVQTSIGEGSTDSDVVRELEKHLPEGFLQSALSKVTRVSVPNKGVHPSQVDELRLYGSEEAAYMEEQLLEGNPTEIPQHEIEADEQRHLYAKLYRESLPKYDPVWETSNSSITVPLEVHLGNIPIDWEDRFHRLTRKARAVVRARIYREEDQKLETREKFRNHVTLLAQRRVDHRIFLLYVSKQSQELELSMSDLPYVDQEEYQRRVDELKFELNPDEYALMVFAEYRRLADEVAERFSRHVLSGAGALLPFMPKTSGRLVDYLEKHSIISHSKATAYRDPIGFLFEGGDARDDFNTWRLNTEEPYLTASEKVKRELWEIQVSQDQAKQANGSAGEVFVQPEEGGLTVSSGDVSSAASDAADAAATESDPLNVGSDAVNTEGEFSGDAIEGSQVEQVEGAPAAQPSEVDSGVVQIGGDVEEEVAPEDTSSKEPQYTQWDRVKKDPWNRHDFATGLDYHIYKSQNALDPSPRNHAIMEENRAQVSFDILDFLNSDGTIDWNHLKVRRMQYPITPLPQKLQVTLNDAYDSTDNTGRQVDEDYVHEREITKSEVEAVSSIDIDSDAGLLQTQAVLNSMRLRTAEDARRKEQLKLQEAKFEGFNLRNKHLDPIVAASIFSAESRPHSSGGVDGDDIVPQRVSTVHGKHTAPGAYNPLRDGWDQDRYEEYMARAYDLAREEEFTHHTERAKAMHKLDMEHKDAQLAEYVRVNMVLPGPEGKTQLEFWAAQHAIHRELDYAPPRDMSNLWSESFYRRWFLKDQKVARGEFTPHVEWVSLRLFGKYHIPIFPTFEVLKPIHMRLWPAFNRLRLRPPSLLDAFEKPAESHLTVETQPSPIKPTYVDPKIAKEDRVFADLSRFHVDRYLQDVRKAYEKYHGLTFNQNKDRIRADRKAEYDAYIERTTLVGDGTIRLVQPAEKVTIDIPIATETERITEAARLTRLGLKKHSNGEDNSLASSSASSSSSAPVPLQSSVNDFTATTPGSLTARAPTTWGEKWELSKQMALDQIIREHSIEFEKENFESWKTKLNETGSAPESIVKYPTYADIAVKGSIFGLPSVDVGKVLKELQKERREREVVARKILKSDLQRAYRTAVVDSQRVTEALTYLNNDYEDIIRRRSRRMIDPIIPDDWVHMLDPNADVGEEFSDDIKFPIDIELASQVRAEAKIPGVDIYFWDKKDSKSRRAQKRLNAFLTRGSPEAIAKWDKKMDEIHARKLLFSEQIQQRKFEIEDKRLREEARSVWGNSIAHSLEQTNFWDGFREQMLVGRVEDLDMRAQYPDADWEPNPFDERHVRDISDHSGDTVYDRLAAMVQASLKDSGAAEAEDEFDEHGHGGHGGH